MSSCRATNAKPESCTKHGHYNCTACYGHERLLRQIRRAEAAEAKVTELQAGNWKVECEALRVTELAHWAENRRLERQVTSLQAQLRERKEAIRRLLAYPFDLRGQVGSLLHDYPLPSPPPDSGKGGEDG